nr:hypothetical protein [Pandoravirus aubagnensis]
MPIFVNPKVLYIFVYPWGVATHAPWRARVCGWCLLRQSHRLGTKKNAILKEKRFLRKKKAHDGHEKEGMPPFFSVSFGACKTQCTCTCMYVWLAVRAHVARQSLEQASPD